MMSSRASRMITIGCGQGKLFSRSLHNRRHSTGYFSPGERCKTVLGGSVTFFWCGSGSLTMDLDPTPDPTPVFRDLKDAKKNF
jgi:hypothetical protein